MAGNKNFIFYICFFLSGFTSLVYETLWIRSFAIAFGGTTFSISLVVALFLLGLAAGAWIGGRWTAALQRPAHFYGWLEGGIGLWALALAFLIPQSPNWLAALGTSEWSSTTWLWAQGFSVFLLLLPTTLAMGMTFPLLVQMFQADKGSVQTTVSRLYGVNTLGAVLGAMATGFLLIPWFGTLYTNYAMVLINLGLCLVGVQHRHARSFRNIPVVESFQGPLKTDTYVFLLITFLTGAVAIGAEVAWNKYLTLFLGSNIFGVSLVLSLFLMGIALGALVLSQLRFKLPLDTLYLWLLAFATLSTLQVSTLFDSTPLWAQSLGFLPPLVAKALVAFVLILPATLSFGALLPLTIALLSSQPQTSAHWAGSVYAWNTLGGLLGSLSVGLLGIPLLGTASTLWILCGILGLAFLIFIFRQVSQNKNFWSGPLLLAFLALLWIRQPTTRFTNFVHTTEFLYSNPEASARETRDYIDKMQGTLRYLAEGENSVISLHYKTDETGAIDSQKLILKSNGLSESFFDLSNPGVVPRYEGLLALVPYLYMAQPQKAFVIGFGGGYTAELLSSFDLDSVLVAEIEQEVLSASEAAYLGPNPLLERNNLEVKIEDARFLLTRSPRQSFDIISSQPSHSWMSGVSHLFTQDFFRIVKTKLRPRGVYSQWLNIYNMDSQTLRSLIHSFFSVFPHGAIYTQKGDDQLILVGSPSPLKLQYHKLKKMTEDPFWRERFVNLPLENEWDYLNHFSMDRRKALSLSQQAPINTDRNALAEVQQSRLFYRSQNNNNIDSFLNQNFHPTLKASKKYWEPLLPIEKNNSF